MPASSLPPSKRRTFAVRHDPTQDPSTASTFAREILIIMSEQGFTAPCSDVFQEDAMSRTIVVGAGMVGLATAWHLQERGVDVTVIDRVGVAAGSSWGNAGWLTPGKTIPLADTGLWTYGPKALLDPDAALHVPFRVDAGLWSFLARFAMHGT